MRKCRNRIKQHLSTAGLSQGKFARMCDIPESHMSKLIHDTQQPQVGTALVVAKKLGIPVEEIWQLAEPD